MFQRTALNLLKIGWHVVAFVLAIYTFDKVKPEYTDKIGIIVILTAILIGYQEAMVVWLFLNLYYINKYGIRRKY